MYSANSPLLASASSRFWLKHDSGESRQRKGRRKITHLGFYRPGLKPPATNNVIKALKFPGEENKINIFYLEMFIYLLVLVFCKKKKSTIILDSIKEWL